VAQKLAQAPLAPQARHWASSHVLWQTPAAQAWHWAGLQGPQEPFVQVSHAPHRVWQAPPMQSSHAPHRVRHDPLTQSWHVLASQSTTLLSMMPSQSSSTPLHVSGGSTAKGLRTL